MLIIFALTALATAEVTPATPVPITAPVLKQEIIDIIHIQLKDNVKARILNSELANNYVPFTGKKKIRSQIETYHYLFRKNNVKSEASSN